MDSVFSIAIHRRRHYHHHQSQAVRANHQISPRSPTQEELHRTCSMHDYTRIADHKISGRKTLRKNKTRTKQPQKSRQYQLLSYRNKVYAEDRLFRVCNTGQQQPMDQHFLQSTKELFFLDRLSDWRRLKKMSGSDSLRARNFNMHNSIITCSCAT